MRFSSRFFLVLLLLPQSVDAREFLTKCFGPKSVFSFLADPLESSSGRAKKALLHLFSHPPDGVRGYVFHHPEGIHRFRDVDPLLRDLGFPNDLPRDPLLPYFRLALSLEPQDRAQVLAALEKSGLRGDTQRFLKIALYDEATWLKHFPEIASLPFSYDYGPTKLWLEVVRNVPPELKAKLNKVVGENYVSASKRDRNPDALTTFAAWGPRRGMDAFLHLSAGHGEKISTHVRNGLAPERAYALVLKEQHETFFSGQEVGKYDADVVFTALKSLQSVLAKNNTDMPVMVTGSFVNGRAKLATSDMDIRFVGQPTLLPAMSETVQKDLAAAGIANNLKLEHVRHHNSKLERLSTLQFFVSRDRIEMAVYPPVSIEMKAKPEVFTLFLTPGAKPKPGERSLYERFDSSVSKQDERLIDD